MVKALIVFAVAWLIADPEAGSAIEGIGGKVGGKPSVILVDGRISSVYDYKPKEDPPIPLGEHVVYMSFNGGQAGITVTGEMAADDNGGELLLK